MLRVYTCVQFFIYILYFLLYYYICLFHFFACFLWPVATCLPASQLGHGNLSNSAESQLLLAKWPHHFSLLPALLTILSSLSWHCHGHIAATVLGSFVAADDDDHDDEPLCASGNNTLFSICATVETPSSPSSLPHPVSFLLPCSGIAWRTCGLQLNVH